MRDFIASCDLRLALGTRFTASSSKRWALQIPLDLIPADVDPANFDVNTPARVRVGADVRAALNALNARLEGPQRPSC